MNHKKNVPRVGLFVGLRMGTCFRVATRLGMPVALLTLILAGSPGLGSAWASEVLGVTLPTAVASVQTQGGPPNNADTYVPPFVATQNGTITTWKAQFVAGQFGTGCGLPVSIQLKVLRATSGTIIQVISAGAVHNPKAILEARFGGTCPSFQSESAGAVIEFTETTGLAVSPGDIIGLTLDSDPDVDAYFYPLVSVGGATRLVLRNVAVGGTIDLTDPFTATLANLAPALEINSGGALQVAIDIKPGSFPNSINLGSAGSIPVAILSSATFDATTVDPATVTLAGASVQMVGKSDKFLCNADDPNMDGLPDLVCHVQTAQFVIQLGESVAVLEAQTFGGMPIRGEDTVRIVPDE